MIQDSYTARQIIFLQEHEVLQKQLDPTGPGKVSGASDAIQCLHTEGRNASRGLVFLPLDSGPYLGSTQAEEVAVYSQLCTSLWLLLFKIRHTEFANITCC